MLLKLELHPVQRIRSNSVSGIFFIEPKFSFLDYSSEIYSMSKLKNGYFPFSGEYISFENKTPNWHKNYFNNSESFNKNIDWWRISDFDNNLGDIKTIWELSRFDWVVQLSIIAVSGDKKAIPLLNLRLNEWVKENPFYKGINWKCGQEASIRVLHLILATLILDQFKYSTEPLVSLIEAHIKRIEPTISYAIAQNNNHGTSEAAALFIGGHFLTTKGFKNYQHLELLGRKWLEDRAVKLFSVDGCFSQYSVNYHRLALDTYSFCETYRNLNNLKPFSYSLNNKIKKAIKWLEILTDSTTGDVPNIGANDGALIFNMFNFGYRDYRKSVQWANLVFNNRLIYSITENQKKIYNHLGMNVNFAIKDNPIEEAILTGNDDGFFIYRKKNILIVFKRPLFKFRPSHSDALHIDLWIDSENILRDGGSYSYNSSNLKTTYYNGVESHNTIKFDNRDQMPVLGRFLFGSWLNEVEFNYVNSLNEFSISSAYIDYLNSYHKRELLVSNNTIIIKDYYSGVKQLAKLKWRLCPNKFDFDNSGISDNEIKIDIKNSLITGNFNRFEELESRFYLFESTLPVIIRKLKGSGYFITKIHW